MILQLLFSRRKAKRCTLTWKSGPKQRRLPTKVTRTNAKTWSGRCLCCCAIFSLEGFQTFNLLFDRLVHWKPSSERQKRHPCKDSLHRKKQFLQRNCYSLALITCMSEYHRCTSYIYIYIDVYRQKWSDLYMYTLCIQYTVYIFIYMWSYSQFLVFLQQWCVSGTSEVHFRGLSLKRSARGAG